MFMKSPCILRGDCQKFNLVLLVTVREAKPSVSVLFDFSPNDDMKTDHS